MRQYGQVLILTVSSKMSGIHQRVTEYLALNPGADIRLVDSRTNSGAEGLLALHAARRLAEGVKLDELAQELQRLRSRAKIFVSLPSLKAMVASGRLNGRLGRVLQIIGFLPLVTINREGDGAVTGLSFSRRRSDRLLINKLKKGEIAAYALVHANNQTGAEAAAAAIEERIGMPPRYLSDISSVVANFAGEGAYAVAFIERDPRDGSA